MTPELTVLLAYLAVGFTSLILALFVDFQENLNAFLKEVFTTGMLIVILWPVFWGIGIHIMIRDRKQLAAKYRTFGTKLSKHR